MINSWAFDDYKGEWRTALLVEANVATALSISDYLRMAKQETSSPGV
ncbi:MAG: hypothetical protein QXO30_01660 [Candidatus Caldarchaeum sp.]